MPVPGALGPVLLSLIRLGLRRRLELDLARRPRPRARALTVAAPRGPTPVFPAFPVFPAAHTTRRAARAVLEDPREVDDVRVVSTKLFLVAAPRGARFRLQPDLFFVHLVVSGRYQRPAAGGSARGEPGECELQPRDAVDVGAVGETFDLVELGRQVHAREFLEESPEVLDDRLYRPEGLPVAQVQPGVRGHRPRNDPRELRPHELDARRVERVQVRHEVQPQLNVPVPVHSLQRLEILRQARPGLEASHELDVPHVHVVVHRVHRELRVHPLLQREQLRGESGERALAREDLVTSGGFHVPRLLSPPSAIVRRLLRHAAFLPFHALALVLVEPGELVGVELAGHRGVDAGFRAVGVGVVLVRVGVTVVVVVVASCGHVGSPRGGVLEVAG